MTHGWEYGKEAADARALARLLLAIRSRLTRCARPEAENLLLRQQLVARRPPPSQGWKTFLRNHAAGGASLELFVVYGLIRLGGTHVETNQLIIRPLIPRVRPYTLLPFMQLVRPTFALVRVLSSRGGSRTEFGDLPLFDIAVLPWPDRRKTGLLVGVGPTLVFQPRRREAPAKAHGRQARPSALSMVAFRGC
jgi:hypothetical protein